MKKGQIVEGIVERTDYPAKGIVRVEAVVDPAAGQPQLVRRDDGSFPVMTVKNVIPGQRIRARVRKVRADKAEGIFPTVIEKAPYEVEPDCPHFGICGGCAYRMMPYEKQLSLKEGQIRRLLESTGEQTHFEGILQTPAHNGYRNKMEFSFGDACKDGPLCLGMHRRGSFYDVVTVDGCQIVDGDFRRILRAVLDMCAKMGLTYYHRQKHAGYLRHLLVRKSAQLGEILVDLVTVSGDPENADPAAGHDEKISALQVESQLVDTLLSLTLQGKIVGILHTVNDSSADAVVDQGTQVLYGRDWMLERLLGMEFKISVFSFFQTNSRGAEVLYRKVRDYIGDTEDKVIFDLYSGTGTIAQMLAPVARHVTGVEIVEEAVNAARDNARRNGLTNCDFIAGDVLKVLDSLEEYPDLIVLDPPRDGVNPKALQKILRYGVDRIVYISCKPTSLVRDLQMFFEAGYHVERSCCIDMFVWTQHIECVTLLQKNNRIPDVKVRIDVDLEDYYRIKDIKKKQAGE